MKQILFKMLKLAIIGGTIGGFVGYLLPKPYQFIYQFIIIFFVCGGIGFFYEELNNIKIF